MQTTVFDVVHMFSEKGISAVPIIDDDGKVLNLYETVDVIVSLNTTNCRPCADIVDPLAKWCLSEPRFDG
jgi:CBS-domain-containing membrane protein